MAKVITFTDIPTPSNVVLTPISGGSLSANTTYYYRIIGVMGASDNTWNGRSLPNVDLAVATTSTEKTIKIQFNMPKGACVSYRIFRTYSVNGAGFALSYCPKDIDVNTDGSVEFVDNGGGTSSNNYFDNDNTAHGYMTIAGGTQSDPFSIVDLYNADKANGWGVIKKIEDNTYLVNTHLVNGENGNWIKDSMKTIIFADGLSGLSLNAEWGTRVSNTDVTSDGVIILFTNMQLSNLVFNTLRMYGCSMRYRGRGNYMSLGFRNGVILNTEVEGLRGFSPQSSNCLIRNFRMTMFDNAFSNGKAVYENVSMYGGSRVWQLGSNGYVYGKGVAVESAYAVLMTGVNSTIDLVNSTFIQPFLLIMDATGTVLNDKITYELRITDEDFTPIENASVKVYDVDDNLVVDVLTDANGEIAEQEITREQWTVTNMTTNPVILKYPFKVLVSANGFETYREVVEYLTSKGINKSITLKHSKSVKVELGGDIIKLLKPEEGTSSDILKL